MIDEKTLQDRLTAAAEAQDGLLPRALADDVSAGRRRLLRRRVLAGASASVAVAAVAVATIGLGGPLRNAAPHEAPAANHEQTSAAESADAAAVSKTQGFNTLMTGLLAKHLDPGRKHLDPSSGPFEVDPNLGSHGTSRKVGWKVAGQRGEGMVLVELSRSQKQRLNTCGDFNQPPITCHPITLPNGRQAMIGHRGLSVELHYLQPDGEFAYVAVDPLFGNMTDVPLTSVGITDAQLIAFVTDPALNLPPLTAAQQAEEDQLKDFAPAPESMEAAAARHLGGKLERTRLDDTAVSLEVDEKWTKGSVSATVELTADPAIRKSECHDQLSVPACTPVKLPNGGEGSYAEGARTYQGGPMYVMGATYVQPDGDLAGVRVLYPGHKAPKDGITKAQLLALLTDPALDR